MKAYTLRRLISLIPICIGITAIVFLLARLVPGDPVTIMLSRLGNRTPELEAELRSQFGLDQPVYVQYSKWMWRVLHGDLGRSFVQGEQVTTILMRKFKATLVLATAGALIAVSGGVLVGVAAALAAVKRTTVFLEKTLNLVPLFLLTTPSFALGLFLIVLFTAKWRILPATGMYSVVNGGDLLDRLVHLILPAFTLGAPSLAATARLTRASLLEVLDQDYIRTARAKGLRDRTVIYRHAIRNAILPIVTNTGILLGNLLAGSVIVETVFSWPGIGFMMVEGIGNRDYPIIQGGALLISAVYVLSNLIVDISYAYIDPRISHG
jgi:peptide/nickel transport system permease protein